MFVIDTIVVIADGGSSSGGGGCYDARIDDVIAVIIDIIVVHC